MNIGIDFDGTITSTNHLKTSWIKVNLGINITPCRCNRTDCEPIIGTIMYDTMSKEVYNHQNTLQLQPLSEAQTIIAELKKLHHLFIVTARKDTGIDSARIWLSNYQEFSDIPLLSMSEGNKLEICLKYKIELLIDDDMRHLASLNSFGIKGVHFYENCNDCNDSILTVSSWHEIPGLISQISDKNSTR